MFWGIPAMRNTSRELTIADQNHRLYYVEIYSSPLPKYDFQIYQIFSGKSRVKLFFAKCTKNVRNWIAGIPWQMIDNYQRFKDLFICVRVRSTKNKRTLLAKLTIDESSTIHSPVVSRARLSEPLLKGPLRASTNHFDKKPTKIKTIYTSIMIHF